MHVCNKMASLMHAVSSSISSSVSSISTLMICNILTNASASIALSTSSASIPETRWIKSVIETLWSSPILPASPSSISVNQRGNPSPSLFMAAFILLSRSNSESFASDSSPSRSAPSDWIRSVCSSISKIAFLTTFIVILRSNPLRIRSGRLCASSTTKIIFSKSSPIADRDESRTASTNT